jgi:hypothetical protein
MMKGIRKIKSKIMRMGEMSKLKIQSSNECQMSNPKLKKDFCAGVILKFEIYVLQLPFEL